MKFDFKILDEDFNFNKKKSYLKKEYYEIIIKDIDEIIDFSYDYLENFKIKGKKISNKTNVNERNKKILKFLVSDNSENLDNLFEKFKKEMFHIKSVLSKNVKNMNS